MRRAAAFVIIPLLAAVAVAGCGSSSSSKSAAASSSASSSASSGNSTAPDTYQSVTVTGAFGKAPVVTIPKVTGTGALLTKTLIQGSGAKLTTTEGMIANYVAYDWSGKTSKLLSTSYEEGLFVGPLLPGLETALIGQKLGSRVLAVIPPADGFGANGPSEGIGATDTLVFVIDMDSTFGTSSVPGKQVTDGGGTLPTVTPPAATSTAGPTIKIPAKVTPSKKLQVKALIKGTGAVVQKGEDIAVQYTGVIWRTGKVFDSSWARKTPFSTVIGEGQVIPGWDTGLVGQTVGSRVLLVIPPVDGYGTAGESEAGIKGTDTLVFVVDILAAS
jgi:FKBP-type peptidyl-prolyl cis-trans isomerase